MRYCLLALGILLCLGILGCAPKNLSPEYNKVGKCVVCHRKTKVRTIPINPAKNISLTVCWRDECNEGLVGNLKKYVPADALPKPGQRLPSSMDDTSYQQSGTPAPVQPSIPTPPAGR